MDVQDHGASEQSRKRDEKNVGEDSSLSAPPPTLSHQPREPLRAVDPRSRTNPPTTPIRVILGDEAPVVLAGLEARLRSASDIAIAGKSTHVTGVLELLSSTLPDVILVDYSLPGGGAMALLLQVQRAPNSIRSIVLASSTNGETIKQVFRAGATGYVLKNETMQDLPEIVRQVHDGKHHISPGVSQSLLEGFLGRPTAHVVLTSRQQEILELIARGRTSREIAHHLGIRLRTVHTHRERLMKKLGVHTATGLVYEARREGLV